MMKREERKIKVVSLIAITETVHERICDKYGAIEVKEVSKTSYFDLDGNFITSVTNESSQVKQVETRTKYCPECKSLTDTVINYVDCSTTCSICGRKTYPSALLRHNPSQTNAND